ncbi:MAG TPA: molybdate ABC transporter substrate-binding protein [Solirubrobacterales bacterium]|nr:molybdate ABC transporter substrate-binding protein [Solirubrobacterales bacterium]
MRARGALLGLAAVLLAALVVAGCGGGSDTTGATGGSGGGTLIVLGASSLTEAVTKYGESFAGATVKPSFAGSDELAAQIQQGAKADVFASANTDYPEELFAEGLVEKPRVFCRNELVIAVPEGSDVKSLADLTKPGTKIVIGDPSVPVGSYTREVLGRLPKAEEEAIMDNVVSEETEVASIVAKLEQGAADAGFVYVTDEKGAEGLEPVEIEPKLQPRVEYGVAVVKSSGDKAAAEEFVDGLIEGEGQEDLRAAGFLPPP